MTDDRGDEARTLLAAETRRLSAQPVEWLRLLLHDKLVSETLGHSGQKYAFETWALDHGEHGFDVVVEVYAYLGPTWTDALARTHVFVNADGTVEILPEATP